jgi:hypothetical protein
MAGTASLSQNRVNVCLAWEQREYIRLGAALYQIGFSEYLRRVLDQHIYGNTTNPPIVPRRDQ